MSSTIDLSRPKRALAPVCDGECHCIVCQFPEDETVGETFPEKHGHLCKCGLFYLSLKCWTLNLPCFKCAASSNNVTGGPVPTSSLQMAMDAYVDDDDEEDAVEDFDDIVEVNNDSMVFDENQIPVMPSHSAVVKVVYLLSSILFCFIYLFLLPFLL